jgi:DNA-binding transcriptional ArsR family regulator
VPSASRADPYAALADPTRRRILTLLSNRERSVTDLVRRFDVSQPAISQHLKVLRTAGIVNVRRNGRQRLYSVDFRRLKAIHDWVSQFEAFWTRKLDALDAYLRDTDSAEPDRKGGRK